MFPPNRCVPPIKLQGVKAHNHTILDYITIEQALVDNCNSLPDRQKGQSSCPSEEASLYY